MYKKSKGVFEENARQTARAVQAVKSIHADIIVEGELGQIGTSSPIHSSNRAETI
jgi:fructose-bisphosphate aldolase class II